MEDLQAQAVAQWLMNGDVFARPTMVQDKYARTRFDLRIQMIEGDVCDTPIGTKAPKGRRIFNGVEVGARDQPVAYWFSDFHPGEDATIGSYSGERKFRRFKAHHASGRPAVLHAFRQERPQQCRGVPILAPVLNLLKDRHDYKEAAIIASQVGACFAAFITTPDPFGHAAGSGTAGPDGIIDQDMTPGMMYGLAPGEDVRFGDPKQPTSQFDAFLHSMTSEACAAIGMPVQTVMRGLREDAIRIDARRAA